MTQQPDKAAGNPMTPPMIQSPPSDGWQVYENPGLGFRLRAPLGWTIAADQNAIHVQSPDQLSRVFVIPITVQAGETAETQILRFPQAVAQLFPRAVVTGITPGANGDVLGTVRYEIPNVGVAWARLMCSMRPDGHGMLFVITAPEQRFESDSPVMIETLNSLQFGNAASAPVPNQNAGRSAASDTAGKEDAVRAAAAKITWMRWTDPRESSFNVETPAGWNIEGGTFRFGASDIRKGVSVRSPEGDIFVQVGDARLSAFSIPDPMMMQMGIREGQQISPTGTFQTIVLRPLSGRDFNRWYLTNLMGQTIDGIVFGHDLDLADLARQQTAALQQTGFPGTVEISELEFTGRSRQSGKAIQGIVHSGVTHFPPGPMGGGIWAANPSLCACWSDGDADARMATAVATLIHMMQTWQEDPNWTAQNNQQQAQIRQQQNAANQQTSQISHEMAMDNIRAAGERSRIIAKSSDDARSRIMGNFQRNMAARDDTQRQFVNYVGDRTDVRDNSGHAWNVGSGYSHYYRDAASDTIIGTNSAYSPGVDFTKLSQF